jgi:hypothetical protein
VGHSSEDAPDKCSLVWCRIWLLFQQSRPYSGEDRMACALELRDYYALLRMSTFESYMFVLKRRVLQASYWHERTRLIHSKLFVELRMSLYL